jgi:hypothetical protein
MGAGDLGTWEAGGLRGAGAEVAIASARVSTGGARGAAAGGGA